VINTSFNMHEEPIVCTPDDAIRAFLQGNLDCLAIGEFAAAIVQERL
jgi:carbamoyltransferase